MCGLSGVVYDANLDGKQLELFRRLLMFNSFRGWDSTGVVDYCHNAKKGNKVLFWKSLRDSATWASSEFNTHYNERWKKTPPSMLLGHSRSATVGKVTVDNAHPFLAGNILGMHNGTVKGGVADYNAFDTDSEAIFNSISKNGLKTTLEDVEKADGAYVLVYLDIASKTLNIVKNSKRPLWYWQADNKAPIFWSSEREHLDNCIKSIYGAAYKGFPKSFDDGKLYTVNYEAYSKNFEFKTEVIFPPKVYGGVTTHSQQSFFQRDTTKETATTTTASKVDVDPYTRLNIEKAGHSVYTDFYKHWDNKSKKWYSAFQLEKLLLADKKGDKLNDQIPFDVGKRKEAATKVEWFPIGPNKTSVVSPARFTGLLSHGCSSCGCVQFVPKGVPFDKETGHADKNAVPIVWVTKDDYLCVDCAVDEAAKLYSDMDRGYKLELDWRDKLGEDLEEIFGKPTVEETKPAISTHIN